MGAASEKGNALENAIRDIETAIFRTSPSLREQDLRIEGKKRITAGGVRHEIDLFVEITIAAGHEAIFIFECKNWKDPVNKNEIIVFSEKIKAIAAQKGFFVAKEFTADAIAQSKQDARIELLYAEEYDSLDPLPMDFHMIFIDMQNPNPRLKLGVWNKDDETRLAAVDMNHATVHFGGEESPLTEFLKKWIDELVHQSHCTFQSQGLPAGPYPQNGLGTREFSRGSFYLSNIEIGSIEVSFEFAFHVLRPPVISHFDVQTKGRSIRFAPVSVPGGTLDYGIVLPNFPS